jgi:hypothetical protein
VKLQSKTTWGAAVEFLPQRKAPLIAVGRFVRLVPLAAQVAQNIGRADFASLVQEIFFRDW